MRREAPAILAGLALCAALSACGEKKENLDFVPETEAGLEPVPPVPKAAKVQAGLAAAESIARTSATERVAPAFEVDPAAWTVSCKDPQGDEVSCAVSAGLCGGSVVITPTKVPAGESAEGYVPRASGERVRCTSPKALPKRG